MKTKKAKKKARTTKRSAISGQWGEGEREAERLARRIVEMLDPIGLAAAGKARRIALVKAELLAAVTVRETAAEAIGAGWARKSRLDRSGATWIVSDVASSVADQYVRLVPSQPPKSKRSTK